VDLFPSGLPGLQWNVIKAPEFKNIVHGAVSGREVRVSEMIYPLWTITLSWSTLKDDQTTQTPAAPYDELKKILGFFLKQNGRLRAFQFDDVSDNNCADMQFGIGDGVTAAFQLTRIYGAGGFTFAEPVQNVNAITNIKDGGITIIQGAGAGKYTINSTGLVTFGTVPAAGHALTWTGTYYYRVRFVLDSSEFNEFANQLWEQKKLAFVGAPGNKV
jgi:uncharacterized protein (TIGR02217 family)